ncbi:MAG: serine/threonine protein kinase [Planctomycetes bacterium]|nr:serine/threonine protein kinase [Planctomycetota bacterium]
MPPPAIRSVLFGKLAVGTRFITEEQLQECLKAQRELEAQGETPPRLGEVLALKGYLTRNQVAIILDSMAKTQKRRFGEIAISFQFVSEAQVNAALEFQALLEKAPQAEEVTLGEAALVAYRRFFAQKKSHADRPKIGEALMALGHLRAHQVDAVLEEQGKVIATCGGCEAALNISSFEPGQRVRCAQCGSVLTVVKLESGAVDVVLPPMTGLWQSPVQEPAAAEVSAAAAPEKGKLEPELATPPSQPEVAEPLPPIKAGSEAPIPARLGDFQVLQALGEDATSRMFRVKQVSRDRIIALKVMRRSVMLDDAFREHFLEEARKAANLDHPNIRKLYSVSRVDDRFCVAMEFIEGESVYGLLQKGRMPLAEAMKIMRAVLAALAVAHAAGVVHRDIRPSNIMITQDGTVKVANLGLSPRVTDSVLKVSESGRVAAFYISPECVTGDRPTDQRVDIYSAGATLFHMLSGKPPFEGKSPFEILMKLSTEQIPSLRTNDPGIPESLNAIVQRMLDPEPDSRYATCEQVLADLDRLPPPGVAQPAPVAPAVVAAKRSLVPVLVALALIAAAGFGWRAWNSSERSDALGKARSHAGGAKRSRAEYAAARAELKRFAEAWPGTPEAETAEGDIAALQGKEDRAAAEELAGARSDVAAAIASGRLGPALARVNTLAFLAEPDPNLGALRKQIEDEATKSWETVAADAIKLANAGNCNDADQHITVAVALRSLPSDEPRSSALRQQVAGIRKKIENDARAEATARAEREEADRRLKETEEARKRWDAVLGEFNGALARWDIPGARGVLANPETGQAGKREDRERLARLAGWVADAEASAIAAIGTTQANWDRKPENDRRLRARIKGADCRATGADEKSIVFAETGGTPQSIPWADLDPRVASEAIRRGAEASKIPEQLVGAAAWCVARASRDDLTLERFLMEEAERRLAEAEAASSGNKEVAVLQDQVAAWADRAQKDAFAQVADLVAKSNFEAASLEARAFRNSFGRRPWAQEHAAALDLLMKAALAGGAADDRCLFADFGSGIGALEASAGWKAADGVLVGNGKEETLHGAAANIEEISFLLRFSKPEFRLVLSAGDADIRLEPSRPRFDLIVRREGTTPLQKSLKDKGDEIRGREWNLFQVRFDGTNVTVKMNGQEEGSIAMASRPGEFTLTLNGVSQTQAGAVDLDCVMVKRK